MPTPQSSAPHAPETHGPELAATPARAGARRGLYKVLGISMLLAIVAMVVVWLAFAAPSRVSSPHVSGATGQPVSDRGNPSP